MGAGTGPLPEMHVLLLVLLAVDVRPFRDAKKERKFQNFLFHLKDETCISKLICKHGTRGSHDYQSFFFFLFLERVERWLFRRGIINPTSKQTPSLGCDEVVSVMNLCRSQVIEVTIYCPILNNYRIYYAL